jgi:hypothetical protein
MANKSILFSEGCGEVWTMLEEELKVWVSASAWIPEER